MQQVYNISLDFFQQLWWRVDQDWVDFTEIEGNPPLKDRDLIIWGSAIAKVIESKYQNQSLSNEARSCYEKINPLLTKSGCAEIYGFIELLNSLGFQISIQVKE